MNNDGNGATYRNTEATSFGKGSFLEREAVRNNYNQKMSSLSNVDSIQAEIAALEKLGQQISKIQEGTKETKKQTEDRLVALDKIARVQKELNDYVRKNGTDEKELLKLYQDSIRAREKATQKYIKDNNFILKQLQLHKEEVKETAEMQEKLSKNSGWQTLSKNLKDFSKDLADFSKALSLDKLVSGDSTKSLRELRRNTMSSMGLTSNQFNDFKNDVLSEVRQLNGSIGGALYGLDDVKWYMSNLNELGIYNTTLAEQQVNAAIVGNKLLGLSVETQGTIIKTMKRTNNNELLQQQNQTIAALLKSNLDVSKEQLAAVAGNTATLMDQMSYLGLTGDALEKLGVSATAGQAAVISGYGVDTNRAVYNLLSDLATNQYGSQNLYKVGSQAPGIINALNSGDYGTALQSLMQSDYYKTLSRMSATELSSGGYSAEDQKIAAMVRESSKLNMSEYSKVMGMSSDDAKKYLDTMQKEQLKSMTWQERLENWFGTFFGAIDWKWFVGLADVAFGIYIASKVIEIGKWIWQLKGKLPGIWTSIKGFGKTLGGGFTHIFSSWGMALAALGGIAALAGAFAMFANDWKRSEEENIPALQGAIFGTREGFANVLWNVGKYLLVGLGIALLAVATGITATFSWPILLIAGAVGLITGILGSIFNKKDKTGDVGGVGGTALGGIGGATTTTGVAGGKAAIKPWGISSRFGPRSYYYKGKLVHDNHKGIDLTSKSGTPLGANAAGYVVAKGTGWSGGRGNYVAIDDASGYRHTYMHMIQPTHLKKGDYVNEAQIVGYMGSTGKSTGTHLHYQINKGSKALDPEPYLTNNLVRATAFGKTNKAPMAAPKEDKDKDKDSILNKFIAEDTRQKDLVASQYANYFATETGMGGPESEGITGTVNKGFGNLIDKLDELSAKQEDQERVLAALTGNMGTSLYKY